MALTIVTGVPGAGKTLFTLDRIKRENIPEKGQKARPVFVFNIPELDYQFFGAQELKDPDKWFELPEGSIIVFDEAQQVFPQRSAGNAVPDKCQHFSTHRHRGYDIFIVTQDASNVDAFIRRMCGRHFHVGRILNREVATVYEFDHFESMPTGYHEKKAAVSVTPWKFPKRLFDRYRSATLHTYKARTPWRLVALPIMGVASISLLVWAIFSISDRADSFDASASAVEDSDPAVLRSFGSGVVHPGIVNSLSGYVSSFQPVVPGVLHTAPAYQEVIEVKSFPKPICIILGDSLDASRSQCRCYTQQVTDYETSENFCRHWARKGFFDFTRADVAPETGGRTGAQPGRPSGG